jgi:TPR repeat protein
MQQTDAALYCGLYITVIPRASMKNCVKMMICVALAFIATPAFSTADQVGSLASSPAANDTAIVKRLSRSCDLGEAGACKQVGWMYQHGEGAPQNAEMAADYYKRSCDLGGTGCNDIGTFYENGIGVPQDYSRAAPFYKMGCDLNDAIACSSLGALYGKGNGVARDPVKETASYRRGCDLGDGVGCRNLGISTEGGLGVPQDYQQAYHLYDKSCMAGSRLPRAPFSSQISN